MAIDFSKFRGTPFQKSVWKAIGNIPRGKTLSYKAIAMIIGYPMAHRAVASAAKNCPIPNLPCHRVIRSDGTIGEYSGLGGVETKRKLLAAEGIFL